MTDKYILNEHGEPRAVESLEEWGRWFEQSRKERIVKQEFHGNMKFSTVFLALDHGWTGGTAPILWETMVFDPHGTSIDCDRCTGGREQAEAMHNAMLRKHGVIPAQALLL